MAKMPWYIIYTHTSKDEDGSETMNYKFHWLYRLWIGIRIIYAVIKQWVKT